MQLIVITSPGKVSQEQQLCVELFELGLQTLHLRKPEAGVAALRGWLGQLPAVYHNRIVLHSHHGLAQEFNLKGLHFTEATKAAAACSPKNQVSFSASFHMLEEVQQPQPLFDYGFLSPVFQSISKKEWPAAFPLDALRQAVAQAELPVIALGGITAAKLPQVQQMGFAGAAVLGAVWEQEKPVEGYINLLKSI